MLIEKARELGVLISESPEFLRMSNAKHAVAENEALSELLDEYMKKREKLVACLADEDGDSGLAVALTDDIERLRGQLTESAILSELITAEEAFSTLLSSINTEINACIGRLDVCSHDCASCGGCAH